jgi:hypothetical protein
MPDQLSPITLSIQEIATAPVGPGVTLEPVLLCPGNDEPWTVGRWNGEGWYDKDGYALCPRLWALLPLAAMLCSCMRAAHGMSEIILQASVWMI